MVVTTMKYISSAKKKIALSIDLHYGICKIKCEMNFKHKSPKHALEQVRFLNNTTVFDGVSLLRQNLLSPE